ncbi:P-loop NTPase [Bdellovibrionota bacterium FG-1]
MTIWKRKKKGAHSSSSTPSFHDDPASAGNPRLQHGAHDHEEAGGGCGGSGGCGSGGCGSKKTQAHSHDDHHDHASPQNPQQASAPSPEALQNVRHVIAIASGKGGVGKSTVTTNLAIAMQKKGAKVGLLDADIYGPSQPGMMGSKETGGKTNSDGQLVPFEKNGVSFVSMGSLIGEDRPLIWRAPMATQMIQQFLNNVTWGTLDYLFIDLPPGTGDVQLTLAQQARLSGAIIVTTPQEVALGIAKKGLQMFQQLNIPILGIVENMSVFTCKHCGQDTAVFKEGGGQRLASSLGVPFLGAIPLDPEIMMSGDMGSPLLDYAPKSAGAEAFRQMATQTNQQLEALATTANEIEPKSFKLAESGKLEMEWPDQQRSTLSAYQLRCACACASCVDERTGQPILDPKNVPQDISIRSVKAVGRYALTMAFSDGHSTGIYSFKKLRTMKPTADRPAPAPSKKTQSDTPLNLRIQKVLDTQINPGVASHGGKIELIDLKGTEVYLKMSGGCQGCSSAKATLQEGVAKTLRSQIPEITAVIDVTDHSTGSQPYYR